MIKNNSVQGFDVHGKNEFVAKKVDDLKYVGTMFRIHDTGSEFPDQKRHDMMKKAGDELIKATTGKNKTIQVFMKYMTGLRGVVEIK